jgi:[acyl-carrier-protein] S-malonyltransferase
VIAFIFPGQGAQAVGMGRALADRFPVCRAAFDEADRALGESLSTLIFDGPAETLTLEHVVRDRSTLVHGALAAARWVIGKRGWFTMRDVLGLRG